MLKLLGSADLIIKEIIHKNDQINCFTKHLELATSIDLPMFLHERDAHDDFVILLREYSHL